MGIRSGIRKAKGIRQSKRISKSNKRPAHRKRLEPEAQEWDKFKSTNENYRNIGLARDLNKQREILHNVPETQLALEVEYEVDVNSIKALNQAHQPWNSENPKLKSLLKSAVQEAVIEKKKRPKLNREEIETLTKLLRKFKFDFEAMRKHIKLNVFQWTEIQCRNKLRFFIEKFGREKLVSIVGEYDDEEVFGRELEEH